MNANHPNKFVRLACKAAAISACTLYCGLPHAQDIGASGKAAAEDFRDIGFSYFLGLGGQTASYHEYSSSQPVRSKATTTSPLIVNGALYAVNHDLLFSLGNETTFAPGSTTETWTATSTSLDGHVLTDPTVQRNGFNLTQNTSQLLGYYRVTGNWFAVGGPSLHTQTFKRYSFVPGVDDAVAVPTDRTIEESTNEIVADLGVALDLSIEGRLSWAIFNDIHAGLWGQWMTSERHRSVIDSTSGTLELPENRLTSLSYGIELLWKL